MSRIPVNILTPDWREPIRQVLMNEWDPIGINNEPNATDEYDGYIPQIYVMLTRGDSVNQLQEHLFTIVRDLMGMSPPATLEHMRSAAEALRRIEL